ncbi:AraC family transcriptional regulator [Caenispirillum bisanense]|uniref:Transcriptional regulator, AraC family n=1 Tax=Caenispirillum bisanense TaxID=414052 RepID=A0A286GVU7_9PROT|nr:AraC family transcriptional regulator [Caenispirillum bisanense]SOD99665.1 transcriptional regulator, AraC family [Caenispirillum bisanense]
MKDTGTVSVCFVHAALEGLIEHGHDPAPVLRKAAIPPELLASPRARVSPAAYGILLKVIAQVLDDELFGQDSRRMKVGTFALLCRSVVHAETLGKALERMTRFFGTVMDDVGATVSRGDRTASLVLYPRAPGLPRHVFLYETLLIFMHGIACWLVRRRIPILRADFAYPRPEHAAEYHVLYSARLRFDQPATAITFDAALLDLPCLQDEQTVKAFLRDNPENMLVKYKNVASDASRVRRLLRGIPPTEWPDFETVAAQLSSSPPTLRRRLRLDGTSFRAIKDQLRRDLALALLADPAARVADVAADLGFAEPSAFHRAFRKWTGGRPGDYHRRVRDRG